MKRRVKLGQHFLIDRDVLAEIISCAAIKKGEKVIEIGPGRGVLTKELLKKGAKVVAIEIDRGLIEILKKNFRGDKNLRIVEADVLRILNSKFPARNATHSVAGGQILNTKYKIIGNIPYQITSPLLRKIFKLDNPPEIIVFMVQKEVAERICAKPGDSRRGFLSVLVQYYTRPKIIRIVPRESFYPVPKVDSAIIKINPKSKILNPKSNERLFRIVQAGFSQKRKKLRNSLAAGLHLEPKEMDKMLQKAGINPNLRAEDLRINEWIKIGKRLKGNKK